jgi:hypothetical protein
MVGRAGVRRASGVGDLAVRAHSSMLPWRCRRTPRAQEPQAREQQQPLGLASAVGPGASVVDAEICRTCRRSRWLEPWQVRHKSGLAPPVARNCARDSKIAPHKTTGDPPRPVVSLQNARTSVPRRSLKHQTHALRPSLLITFISNTLSWQLPALLLSHKQSRSRILLSLTRNSSPVSDTLVAVATPGLVPCSPVSSLDYHFARIRTCRTTPNTVANPTATPNSTVNMRSFQQIVVFLFALLVSVMAQDTESYDATVYITSTVYRVNTVTMSGQYTGSAANMTSTIPPTGAATYAATPKNGTSLVQPTGAPASSSPAPFTGAASALNINAYVAALAAGVGYLVL